MDQATAAVMKAEVDMGDVAMHNTEVDAGAITCTRKK
jgi:hypothetical protein